MIYIKDNEAIHIISEDEEEWYGNTDICSKCGTVFMCDDPEYCPSCGAKFIGTKSGSVTIYNCKGDNNGTICKKES